MALTIAAVCLCIFGARAEAARGTADAENVDAILVPAPAEDDSRTRIEPTAEGTSQAPTRIQPGHAIPPPRPSPPSGPTMARYGGIVSSILGALALGAGVYFGSRARSTENTIQRDGTVSQVEAFRRRKEASDFAGRAHLAFGMGGALTVTGGGLLFLDLFNSSVPEPAGRITGPLACASDTQCSHGEVCSAGVCDSVAAAPEPDRTFALEGIVADKRTGGPVTRAKVFIGDNNEPVAVSNKMGSFRVGELPARGGLFAIIVQAPGYKVVRKVVARGSASSVVEVVLEMEPVQHVGKSWLRGQVLDAVSGRRMAAEISVPNLDFKIETDKNGKFAVELEPGEYKILVRAQSYMTQEKIIKMEDGGTVILNVDMRRNRSN